MGDAEPSATWLDADQLFELSLAASESVELRACCERFVQALSSVKRLTYASVWLWQGLLEEDNAGSGDGVVLVVARPWERLDPTEIDADHALLVQVRERSAFSYAAGDEVFVSLQVTGRRHATGALACLRLGELGFLLIHDIHRQEAMADLELHQLGGVVLAFTVSLEGCLAHHRLSREVQRRRRAEAALQHREQRYRALFEHAMDLVLVLDYDGTVRFVTEAIEALLGLDPGDVVDRSFFELVHPDEVSRVFHSLLAQARSPGVGPRLEVRLRHRDGAWRAFEARVNNLLTVPAVAGLVLSCHDVTSRRDGIVALEEERQRALDAGRARDDLLVSLGRDAKASLHAIVSGLDALSDRASEEDARQLELVRNEGVGLLQTIEGTLAQLSSSAPEEDRAAVLVATDADGSAALLSALRILVVDDDETNRQIISLLLQRLGCRPDSAAGGAEAVELAEREDFDLVLMDIQMPGMDGLEAVRRCRSQGHCRDARVVAMTARSPDGKWRQWIGDGFDGLLAKPVRLEELADLVAELVAERGAELRRRVESAVDQEQLERLRRITPPDLFASILGKVRDGSRAHLASIRHSLEVGDAQQLRREAHAMRGKLLSIGASRAARVCAQVEELTGVDQGLERAGLLVSQLEQEQTRVSEVLARELGSG